MLQIHSINPLERLNAENKRRTNVVGILHNDAAITRLVGTMLLENDEWSLNRRYMQLEGLQSLSELPRLCCCNPALNTVRLSPSRPTDLHHAPI